MLGPPTAGTGGWAPTAGTGGWPPTAGAGWPPVGGEGAAMLASKQKKSAARCGGGSERA